MVTHGGEPRPGAPADAPPDVPDQVQADRFKHLPPAVPIAATVAVVGAVPVAPVGPDGAIGDGDAD